MTYIAVTQRTQYVSENQEMRDALDQRWVEFFAVCGMIPLIIPNHDATTRRLISIFPLTGILLTGGNASPEREATESILLKHAIQTKIPVLGVCHGMQFIQQHFGVILNEIAGHVVPRQEILVNNKKIEVNSYHTIGTTQTSPELIAWAKAEDGVVKAVKHQSLPIVGVMWHPERLLPFHDRDILLFKKIYSGETACIEQLF
ncbi:MAG: hypothetical protein K0S63_1434 [Gammaproteobacteria bacterium]|jgi:putative glutamine amidotransferase|nr:hypothetical protein [Gammaproteobacteria bacterium]